MNNLGGFKLLKSVKEGHCPECAVKHQPGLPHNQQSLYYQYNFREQHGRWPTWKDAMSHCSAEMKQYWIKELSKKGVIVETNDTIHQAREGVGRNLVMTDLSKINTEIDNIIVNNLSELTPEALALLVWAKCCLGVKTLPSKSQLQFVADEFRIARRKTHKKLAKGV